MIQEEIDEIKTRMTSLSSGNLTISAKAYEIDLLERIIVLLEHIKLNTGVKP